MRKYPRVKTATAAYVGRIERDTNLIVYLKALPLLKKKISLDVYGDGSEKKAAEMLVLSDNLPVAFHGWSQDIASVYKEVKF